MPTTNPCQWKRAGAAIGCGRHRSVGEAERKWRPRLCTNHVRPEDECHPAPTAGVGGRRRARTPPTHHRRPAPQDLRREASPQGAARSPEAPRPHFARSVAVAGQAQRARPARGAMGTPRHPALGRSRGQCQMTTLCDTLPGRAFLSPLERPDKCNDKAPGPGQAGCWPAGRRTPRPSRVAAAAAAQPPGSRARRPGQAWSPTPAASTRCPGPCPEPSRGG